jgi:hypothetical protein
MAIISVDEFFAFLVLGREHFRRTKKKCCNILFRVKGGSGGEVPILILIFRWEHGRDLPKKLGYK